MFIASVKCWISLYKSVIFVSKCLHFCSFKVFLTRLEEKLNILTAGEYVECKNAAMSLLNIYHVFCLFTL